jgi:hypothetical protein
MPNPAPSSPAQNLRSKQGKATVRETPSERAARKAKEAQDAERRAARAEKAAKQLRKQSERDGAEVDAERRAARAAKAAQHQKESERVVEVVEEVTQKKRVVGERNKTKKKRAKESRKKKNTEVASDSDEIDSGNEDSDDESLFTTDDDDDDGDVDKGKLNSLPSTGSHGSDIDSNPSESPEEGRRRGREEERMRRVREAVEAGRRRGRKSDDESRRSAQAGTANPLRTSDSGEHGAPPPPPARDETRAIVSSVPFMMEVPTAQKNVARRIVLFVKNTLFRQIKFVTSAKAFNEAFQKVLVEERPRDPYIFQLTYQDTFKMALNAKRSTCELSGKKIVIRAINTVFKKRGEEFFTFEEICKLRRATTDREREAFFWFFDSFLVCVCGVALWNKAKTKQLVSEARDSSGSKVVSVSDEAFALLLIDNYLEKWKIRADEGDAENIEVEGDGAAAITTEGQSAGRKQTKTPGKYTGKAKGQCKWGGWSSEGIKQFNFLRKLVKADREADKNREDEPSRMEKLLVDFCRTKAGIKDPTDDVNLDGAGDGAQNNAAARAQAMETVDADWDSDGD